MINYIFMTEEESMEEALYEILPKISDYFHKNNKNITYRIISHNGKGELEKSIAKKLKVFKNNDVCNYKFIIIRDKDKGDCKKIKENLKNLCLKAGRKDVLIRIAIYELESWFLGDLEAIDKAYDLKISKHIKKKKFRDPDKLSKPSDILKDIVKNKNKINMARKISEYMDIRKNKSKSFNVFINGIEKLIKEEEE